MKTQIIATLGPVTQDEEKIKELIDAGVSVLRINMSHGNVEWTKGIVEKIRKSTDARIMLDTKGPEIRVSKVPQAIEIQNNEMVQIAYEKDATSPEIIPVTYPGISNILKAGDKIVIDSGKMVARVDHIEGSIIYALVIQGGTITSGRHLNLPGVYIDLPILTESDKENITAAASFQFDKLALSFVRNKEDIEEARAFLKTLNVEAKIISKIEHVAALENLMEIIEASDEIMVARGDLGVEIPWHKIAVKEEQIIQACKEKGKPVIVATQMLLSMQENAIPTRAEVMDVTIAVQLGANFIMLSDETTVGKYPKETVQAMKKIAEYAEGFPIKETIFQMPIQF